MIIDFSGGINESRVQEMINEALSFTASVINLTNASAEEIKAAFANPDGVLCLADYSGATYFERERRTATNGDISVYFYVLGAEPDTFSKSIYDKILTIQVTPSTGEIYISTSMYYAPDTIYYLDYMNAAQIAVLYKRMKDAKRSATYRNANRFSVKWTYNGRQYTSIGLGITLPDEAVVGISYTGTSIMFCRVDIGMQGDTNFYEYTSNIQLTLVQ